MTGNILDIGELKYKNKNKVMKGEIVLNEKDR